MLGKSLASAVNLIPPVVGGELICRAVEGEPGIRNPVGDPADDLRLRGESVIDISVQRIGAEDHVGEDAVAVGRLEFIDHRAQGHHFDAHAPGVAQGELLNGCAVGHFAKVVLLDPRQRPGVRGINGSDQRQQCQRKQKFGQAHAPEFGKLPKGKQNRKSR